MFSFAVDWKDITTALASWSGAVVAFICSFHYKNEDAAFVGCATGAAVGVASGAYSTYTSVRKGTAKVHTQ